jgi:hypothetical protein
MNQLLRKLENCKQIRLIRIKNTRSLHNMLLIIAIVTSLPNNNQKYGLFVKVNRMKFIPP